MNILEKKATTIFKQPSFRIVDMLRKKDSTIDISTDILKYLLSDISNFFKLLIESNLHVFFVIDYKNEGDIGKNILSSKVIQEIKELSRKSLYVYILDKNCHIIESVILSEEISVVFDNTVGRFSYEKVSALADQYESTFIYGYDDKFDVYHEGKLIQPACSIDLSQIPKKLMSCIKPLSQYKELIEEHFNQCVKYSQATDHWNNKANRVLRSSPEDIFKNSLWFYLYMFSEDTNGNVIAEYPLRSGDRIDIYAQTKDYKSYIFEVKVLGKYYSEQDRGFLEYKEDRVHHGLNQTIVYLNELKDNLHDIEKAELIVYDARETQNSITIPESEQHDKIGEPRYFYLESKNATNKARMMTSSRKSS